MEEPGRTRCKASDRGVHVSRSRPDRSSWQRAVARWPTLASHDHSDCQCCHPAGTLHWRRASTKRTHGTRPRTANSISALRRHPPRSARAPRVCSLSFLRNDPAPRCARPRGRVRPKPDDRGRPWPDSRRARRPPAYSNPHRQLSLDPSPAGRQAARALRPEVPVCQRVFAGVQSARSVPQSPLARWAPVRAARTPGTTPPSRANRVTARLSWSFSNTSRADGAARELDVSAPEKAQVHGRATMYASHPGWFVARLVGW